MQGWYSDYHVQAVFSSLELAQEYFERYKPNAIAPEEWEVDAPKTPRPHVLRCRGCVVMAKCETAEAIITRLAEDIHWPRVTCQNGEDGLMSRCANGHLFYRRDNPGVCAKDGKQIVVEQCPMCEGKGWLPRLDIPVMEKAIAEMPHVTA